MSDWLPISTAPRNGSTVLLWSETWEGTWGVVTGRWTGEEWETSEGSVTDDETMFVGDDEDEDQEVVELGPSHWLPIPRPPGLIAEAGQ